MTESGGCTTTGNFEFRRVDESCCSRVNQSESNGSKLSLVTLRSNLVKPDEGRRKVWLLHRARGKSFAYVMKKYTEPMMDFVNFSPPKRKRLQPAGKSIAD
jgi:hypothetical protein